jgi:hypothetical protein
MRKFLIVILSMTGLAASCELAAAAKATCTSAYKSCYQLAQGTDFVAYCQDNLAQCYVDGSWGRYGSPGTYDNRAPKCKDCDKAAGTAPRVPTSTGGSPIVRDHRNGAAAAPAALGTAAAPPVSTVAGPVVRDHRNGAAAALAQQPAGVTKANTAARK